MPTSDEAVVAAAYDAVADEYTHAFADELDRKPFDRRLLDSFAARVAGRGGVCDVGCGPGHVAAYLAARGAGAFGLDLSSAMVASARRLHPALRFVEGNALAIDDDDGSWAGASAFYSLIHLPRDVLPTALRELRRVLSPSAPLLVAVHGGHGEHVATEFLGKPVRLTATLYRLEELTAAIADTGFSVETAEARPPYDFEFPSERLYVLAS